MILLFDWLMKTIRVDSWKWLYTEAGHGKGAADGVGAAVKSRCNEVAARHDIISPHDVLQAVRASPPLRVIAWLVEAKDAVHFDDIIVFVDGDLAEMPGVMKMHDSTGSWPACARMPQPTATAMTRGPGRP
jgi:hypothetical protein